MDQFEVPDVIKSVLFDLLKLIVLNGHPLFGSEVKITPTWLLSDIYSWINIYLCKSFLL